MAALVIYLSIKKQRRLNKMKEKAIDAELVGESDYMFTNEYLDEVMNMRGRLFTMAPRTKLHRV